MTREEKERARADQAKALEIQKEKQRQSAKQLKEHIEALERARKAADGKDAPHEKLSKGEVGKVQKGSLVCNGKQTDSEIIYWRVVPGDADYESPITPHHDNHHDRYLTFEYDNGGWCVALSLIRP